MRPWVNRGPRPENATGTAPVAGSLGTTPPRRVTKMTSRQLHPIVLSEPVVSGFNSGYLYRVRSMDFIYTCLSAGQGAIELLAVSVRASVSLAVAALALSRVVL